MSLGDSVTKTNGFWPVFQHGRTFWNCLTTLNASCVTWTRKTAVLVDISGFVFTNGAHYQTITTLVFSIDNVSLSCSTTRLLNVTLCLFHDNVGIFSKTRKWNGSRSKLLLLTNIWKYLSVFPAQEWSEGVQSSQRFVV